MELAMTNGFMELNQNEMEMIEGGKCNVGQYLKGELIMIGSVAEVVVMPGLAPIAVDHFRYGWDTAISSFD